MWYQRDAFVACQRSDTHHLSYAADLGNAGLRIVDSAGVEHRAKICHADRILARRQSDPALTPQARESRVIFGRPYRFLEPVQIELAHLTRYPDRFVYRPRTIRIHHELDVRTDRLTRRFYLPDTGLMQLDRTISALHRCGRIARDEHGIGIAHQACVRVESIAAYWPEQPGERFARNLAGDIP